MDCTQEASRILLKRFNALKLAVDQNDLSQASFPLTGEYAELELRSKCETLQWVLEMLNITDEKAETEFLSAQLITEAQIIYDGVCDRAMESGRDLPWWSELDDHTQEHYIERAKRALSRRASLEYVLKGFSTNEVSAWLYDQEDY